MILITIIHLDQSMKNEIVTLHFLCEDCVEYFDNLNHPDNHKLVEIYKGGDIYCDWCEHEKVLKQNKEKYGK